jgi:hypothetical protein
MGENRAIWLLGRELRGSSSQGWGAVHTFYCPSGRGEWEGEDSLPSPDEVGGVWAIGEVEIIVLAIDPRLGIHFTSLPLPHHGQ